MYLLIKNRSKDLCVDDNGVFYLQNWNDIKNLREISNSFSERVKSLKHKQLLTNATCRNLRAVFKNYCPLWISIKFFFFKKKVMRSSSALRVPSSHWWNCATLPPLVIVSNRYETNYVEKSAHAHEIAHAQKRHFGVYKWTVGELHVACKYSFNII